mgnify:CR=1 FL=1
MEHRIEQHVVKRKSKCYEILNRFSHLTNNLYNHANFIIRQNFFHNLNEKGKSKYLSNYQMDKILRQMNEENYQQLPKQTAQQTLKVLNQNWQSFFKSIKDYKKNPHKYKGRPKPPKYRTSGGLNQIILTNQQCKIKNDYIHFPKVFGGLTIPVYKAKQLTEVKIIPNTLGDFDILVGYKIEVENCKTLNNNHYLSIDLGLDNFIAMTSNQGLTPVLVNGKGLKAKNQYFNNALLLSKLELERCQNGVDYSVEGRIKRLKTKGIMKNLNQSDFEKFSELIKKNKPKGSNQHMTKRMYQLYRKRHNQIMDYFHKVSKFIVDYCLKYDISQVIIGHNKGQNQQSKIKHFNQIPIFKFIDLLEYKLREVGIILHRVEESYTSGTSFLDDEQPNKSNYDKKRRVNRGLFKSSKGLINADVNGALQIMKKYDDNVKVKWGNNYFNPIKISNV